eukprot:gene1223-1545_t
MTSSLPSLSFKFDVSRLKAKIDEVETLTKKTFNDAAISLGVGGGPKDLSKPMKSKYYLDLIQNTSSSLTEEEFLKITPSGFFEESFDSTQFILDLLPPNTNTSAEFSAFLDTNVNQFSRSMDYVNSKLYNRVRKNYTEFVDGMSQIHEIGVELQRSTVVCSNSRRTLAETKKKLTNTAFVVMHKYNKRQMLHNILVDLSKIKDIVTLERLLKQTLSDGDYPTTIKLYLECRETITQNRHYHCVPELDRNLQEIYHVVQERIDKDFFNSCRSFNPKTYERVFTAYKLLGRANLILDKLKVYFVDPIKPETRNIVYSHVLLSDENVRNAESFKGMGYKDLCKELKDEHFVNCLLAIFEYLCDVMTSLYLMNQFHEDNPMKEESNIFADINSALTRFKKIIWDTMQKQVTYLLAPRKLSNFKIDDFLLVLNSVSKISEIGEEFSGNPSHNLRQSIINQSKSYFENLHRTRVDDLRTMLENEPWTSIPVSSTFNARSELRLDKIFKTKMEKFTGDQLFQSIKEKGNPFSQLISYKNKKGSSTPTFSSAAAASAASANKADNEEDSDEDEELKQEYINEDGEENDQQPQKQKKSKNSKEEEKGSVLVSSSTISFVRYIGKYLELMETIPNISSDIFLSICQLVEYYMYTIYSFSGYLDPQGFSLEALTTRMEKTLSVDDLLLTKPQVSKFINKMKERVSPPSSSTTSVMSNLTTNITNISPITSITNQFSQFNLTIKNIAQNINSSPTLTSQQQSQQPPSSPSTFQQNSTSTSTTSGQQQQQQPTTIQWIPSKINYVGLQLGDPKYLFNLPVRMVAIDSLTFIMDALKASKLVFQNLLHSNQTDNLNDFYKNVVDIIPDLQKYLVKATISAIFSHQVGPQYISNTIVNFKWDLKTMGTTKSPYIETFTKIFSNFFKSLDDCIQKSVQVSIVPVIDKPMRNRIVELSFEFFIEQLVDGYSKIKKCTNEGRATMIQDLMSLQNSLEKISGGVRIPNLPHAENYIKGFYQLSAFSEQDIIVWAREHEEYPIRYVINLIQLAKINKPSVIPLLEELDRKRRK